MKTLRARTQQSLETKRARLDRSRTRPSRNTQERRGAARHSASRHARPPFRPGAGGHTDMCAPWTSELKRATVGDKRVVRCDDDTF